MKDPAAAAARWEYNLSNATIWLQTLGYSRTDATLLLQLNDLQTTHATAAQTCRYCRSTIPGDKCATCGAPR